MRSMRVLAVLLLLLVCFSALGCGSRGESPALRIHCLDVGQGDCTLIRTSAGDVLIDAGTEASQESLRLRLELLGVERLELLILTHADEDHIGGADMLLRHFDVARVWLNPTSEEGESLLRLSMELYRLELAPEAVSAGSYADIGECRIAVLFPHGGEELSGNAASLTVKLSCKSASMLFMGDGGAETEEKLLAAYPAAQLQADILHVGHHGSDTASTAEFLAAVRPARAVISCGRGNSYGHPDGRTLQRLEAAGAEILRTDRRGELVIDLTADGKFAVLGSDSTKEKGETT